ncbi:MAG: class I SAM-dependent methyltransferase [Actinomycetota bacterium]|nr:class I SAM-dependent methyltransferase [Actinomycetota bacterium]
MTAEYDALAEVYEWLVPDDLLEPEGATAAFEQVLEAVPPGGRVLDCAAGSGQLAVGLALRGYDVVATDVSSRMVGRTHALARQFEVDVHAAVSAWHELGHLGLEPFAAVFCIGNSLTHAAGVAGRRSALASMRSQLQAGGVLAVTSRNWELVRASESGLRLPSDIVVRHGMPALVVHSWTIPDRWDLPHCLEVGVALLHDHAVTPHVGRLTFWPFTHDTLRDDLRACGLTPQMSTYAPTVERYLVTATAT